MKKSVAEFFANRFDAQGMVSERKVKPEEIIDFFDSRSEAEVIVKTNFLK